VTASGVAPNPPSTEVYDATLAELQRFGRVASPMGVAALTAARRIDEGGGTASGLASLMGRWMDALSKATEGAKDEADPLDDLQRVRLRRLGVVS
jgi:hypothetical protein